MFSRVCFGVNYLDSAYFCFCLVQVHFRKVVLTKMREKRTVYYDTNDFKAKALRWADENCKGDSMPKMAKKVEVEFGVVVKERTWRRWYKEKKEAILATADNESELGSARKASMLCFTRS